MTVALFTHPACLDHDPGNGHPECPARLAAILIALDAEEFAKLDRREAPVATAAQLTRVHTPAYVDTVLAMTGKHVVVDADTRLSPGSVAAALRAAGAATAAVDAVLDGSARHTFAAVRPPGHHAEAGEAMGFCVFNSVAVAASHARDRWGLKRVAVLDFDVHHGNGTEAIFWKQAGLFYGSTHQMPCYPGTGAADERGGAATIVNRPLPPGSGSLMFRTAWTEILAELQLFVPDLVIVSAGFDAHFADPLASLELTEADFAWLAARLVKASGGHLVSVLEGGYHLPALAASTAAYLRVLLEEDAVNG